MLSAVTPVAVSVTVQIRTASASVEPGTPETSGVTVAVFDIPPLNENVPLSDDEYVHAYVNGPSPSIMEAVSEANVWVAVESPSLWALGAAVTVGVAVKNSLLPLDVPT